MRDSIQRQEESNLEIELSPTEVRRRAAAGGILVAFRGVVVNLLTLGGGVVLARLLLPRDFGMVAVGTTMLLLAAFLSDAGIGASLIRSRMPFDRRDLEAVLAFQLALGSTLGAIIAAVAWPFGETGRVTAAMMVAVPVTAFRAPGMVVLERRLSYRPIAIVEVAEMAAFYVWAVATAAAGWGVWSLATAAIVRATVGSASIAAASPVHILRPCPSWIRTRRLLAFGARFQAVSVTTIARDQTLNLGTAAIGGVAVLGLWAFARRLFDAPFLLLGSLWRVSYPAMSRLLAAGERPRSMIEQAVRLTVTGTGVLLVPLVGSAPALIPVLLGAPWAGAATVLPWAGLGLMISGPVAVAASGYLWAAGDARTPLRASVADAVVWCSVSLTLVPFVGVRALGIGWLAGALAQTGVLSRGVSRLSGANVVVPLIVPTTAAAVAAVVGWTVASSRGETIQSAALGAIIAEAIYLGLLALLKRELLAELAATTRRVLQASRAELA